MYIVPVHDDDNNTCDAAANWNTVIYKNQYN